MVRHAPKIFTAAALVSGLLLGTMTATADTVIYRWNDEQGNPVVSDRAPPPGVEFERITTRSSLVSPVEDTAPATPAPPPPRSAPPAKTQPPKTEKTIFKKNPEYCAHARKNLETLQLARIRFTDENGVYRFMTEEDKEAERKNALEIIEMHCE